MTGFRINFTVEQARKVLAAVPPGTHYWFEAKRCLDEAGVASESLYKAPLDPSVSPPT